jgi:hypothetical protein
MADETPQEKEERLQKQEERLQKQHVRLKERASLPKGGGSSGGGGGGGKGFGEVFSFLAEHKITMFVVGGVAVLAAVIYFINSSGNGNNTGSTSANTPTQLANSGYQDAGTAYALDQLTTELQNIQNEINNPPKTTPPPVVTPPPPGGDGGDKGDPPPRHKPPRGNPPPPSHNYVYDYSNGKETLQQMASLHHLSLGQIEALNTNPHVQPGVILHQGYRVRVR